MLQIRKDTGEIIIALCLVYEYTVSSIVYDKQIFQQINMLLIKQTLQLNQQNRSSISHEMTGSLTTI